MMNYDALFNELDDLVEWGRSRSMDDTELTISVEELYSILEKHGVTELAVQR